MVKVKLQIKDGQLILVDDSQTWMAQMVALDCVDLVTIDNKKLQAELDTHDSLKSDWYKVSNAEYGWGEVIATAHCTFSKAKA